MTGGRMHMRRLGYDFARTPSQLTHVIITLLLIVTIFTTLDLDVIG